MNFVSITSERSTLNPTVGPEEKCIKGELKYFFITNKDLIQEKPLIDSTCGYLFEIFKSCWTISKHQSSVSLKSDSIQVKIPKEYGPLCKHLAETPSARYKTAIGLQTSINTESQTTLVFGPAFATIKKSTEKARFQQDCKRYLQSINVPKESLTASVNYLWSLKAITHTPEFTLDGAVMTTETPKLFGIAVLESEADIFETIMARTPISRNCAISYKGKVPLAYSNTKSRSNFEESTPSNLCLFQFGLDDSIGECVKKIALTLIEHLQVPPLKERKRIRLIDDDRIAIVLQGEPNVSSCIKLFQPIIDSHDCNLTFIGINQVDEGGQHFTEFVFESPEFDF